MTTTKRTSKADRFRPKGIKLDAEPENTLITQSGRFNLDDIAKIGPKGIQMKEYERNNSFTERNSFKWEDFDIQRKLGCGASASVKKAIHKKTGEKYAMKCVTVDFRNEMNSKVIVAEFKALCKCNCPRIITMYDAFFRESQMYVILEYMDCGSLEDVVTIVGKIPENVLAQMTQQMLIGLEYLHKEKQIVHRDIKPANILVNSRGEVKLADFGMAGYKSGKNVFTTFQGTFTYMSPERIKGLEHTFNSDIWSIGVTVAQCALGYFPFELKENTIWEMAERLESNVLSYLPSDKLSKELINFLSEALKIDPKERASAETLLQHEWIKMHENSKPSVRRWLHSTFIKKVKQKQAEKRARQQQQNC